MALLIREQPTPTVSVATLRQRHVIGEAAQLKNAIPIVYSGPPAEEQTSGRATALGRTGPCRRAPQCLKIKITS